MTIGYLAALLILAFYTVCAWRLRPWGWRWHAVRVSVDLAGAYPGPGGMLATWIVLCGFGLPVIGADFFTELQANPTGDDADR